MALSAGARAVRASGLVAAAFALALASGHAQSKSSPWASFEKPWAADSPWNSTPEGVVLGQATIPLSSYYPAIEAGTYSVSAYKAEASDPEVFVYPNAGHKGVWDPDREAEVPRVRVPHWPADVTPAIGSDGHADIVDVASRIVHSFYQLRWVDGQWHATQYAWSPLNGSGWGDPAHYFQGARAAGVPPLGGLIRRTEIHDGEPMYGHALAMSLTYNGLSSSPTYVYPATASDADAARKNSGAIPMGSLLMLPPDFDLGTLKNPTMHKIGATLQTRGGYVVDRNIGTPYTIYAEIGSELWDHKGWDSEVASELQRIRVALRPVQSVRSWRDGDGHEIREPGRPNLLSLRGPWEFVAGSGVDFEGERQQLRFLPGTGRSIARMKATTWPGRVTWGQPVEGQSYVFEVQGDARAHARLRLTDCPGGKEGADTGTIKGGERRRLVWPDAACRFELTVEGEPGGSLGLSLRATGAPAPDADRASAAR